MDSIAVPLPDSLRSFVEEQVINGGFASGSDYVLDLIRKDRDRLSLRALLVAGAKSESGSPADAAYFASLRDRVSRRDRQ